MFLLVEVITEKDWDSTKIRENKFCSNDVDKLRQHIIQEYQEIKESELDELLSDAECFGILHNGRLIDLIIEEILEL